MSSKTRPVVKATVREHLGSKYAKRLRRQGLLPAVMYGHEKDPAHVAIDAREFVGHLHHGVHLLDVDANGASGGGSGANETCLIKDVQYDYLGTTVVHVDLARIDLNEEITVSVPITIKGQDKSPGAKAANAIVENPIVDLEVTCLATNIPDEIVVDISALNVDDAITVADLKLPEGVTTEHNADDVVVTITVVAEEAEAAEPVAEGAEPEVLTAKKVEGEGDAAPASAPKGEKKG